MSRAFDGGSSVVLIGVRTRPKEYNSDYNGQKLTGHANERQILSDLSSGHVPEGPAQIEFYPSRNSVCVCVCVCMGARGGTVG